MTDNRLDGRGRDVGCTALLLLLALALPTLALAQTPPAKAKPSPSAKPAAKTPPKPAAPVAPALPAADAEQLKAAELAHLGDYDCEFGLKVNVDRAARHAGYIDVKHQKTVWTMKPVHSSTGALRLEDVKGRMLMIQVANKSMVLDTKLGQRVLDGCLHEVQRSYVKPADSEALGIAPPAAASAPR